MIPMFKNSYKWLALSIVSLIIIGFVVLIIERGMSSNSTSTPANNEQYNLTSELPSLLSQIDDIQNSKDIDFTNGWKSNLIENERYIIVEVGSIKSDSKQGVAIVKNVSKDGSKVISEKKYLTPEKHGSIKIDSFNAYNLGITAEDGYKLILNTFDGFRIVVQ